MIVNGVDYEIVRIVALAAEDAGVDPALLAGIVSQESGWDPAAEGDHDALGVPHSFGLGQLHDQGAGAGLTPEQATDPFTNARRSAEYLRACLDRFPERQAAICAYNAGIGYVEQNGWTWNQDRYVLPVLASARTWQPIMVQVRVLAHLDAVWGAFEQIRRGRSRRHWCAAGQAEIVQAKKAVGLE